MIPRSPALRRGAVVSGDEGSTTTFVLRLRPGPGCGDPIRALRRLLKFAWRACGLRAIRFEQVENNTQQQIRSHRSAKS